MRDPERISEVMIALLECWTLFPDIRLGQLVENIYSTYNKDKTDMFYIEDEDWLCWIKSYAEEYGKGE